MHNLDLAAGTQRRRLAALRSFFDWAMTEHVHERNPARHPDVKPMPPDNAPSSVRLLTKLEVRDTLEAAGASDETGLRDQAIILTTLHAALRRSEIAGVEVGDIRPLGRYWILEVNYDDAEGEYVRIPDRVVDVIDNVKGQFGLTAGPLWRSMSNRNRGEPLSADAIYTIVRQAGKTAGVGPITIDTLRRTGLRFAADGGASLSQIQAHGRFGNPAAAAQVHDLDTAGGNLQDSAAMHIDFDASGVLRRA